MTGDGRTLLLVAHGSRRPGAMAGLERFRTRLEAAFPDWRVAVARTMGRQHGPAAAYGGVGRVAEVLEGLLAAGARRIVVQSLHVVPGEEYQEMLAGLARQAAAAGERSVLTVGAPLLAGPGDVERVARALLARLPERRPDEGLVVMGHGAPPPAADFYAALGERLAAVDRLALFGTMPLRRGDPCPDIDRIRRTLVAAGTRTAWLVPFFTVAGAHACVDLAGDGDASWRGRLAAAGIACRPVLAGLIDDPACQAVWRDHLTRAKEEDASGGQGGASPLPGPPLPGA